MKNPGPGAYRTAREFPLFDDGDCQQGLMSSGRLPDARYSKYSSKSPKSTKPANAYFRQSDPCFHLKEGHDIDMRNTCFPKSASFSISKTPLNRTKRNLKDQNPILLPSSFYTPGPGAYTAFSVFGSPHGGTRNQMLGTKFGDNPRGTRSQEKFGSGTITGAISRSTVKPIRTGLGALDPAECLHAALAGHSSTAKFSTMQSTLKL